MERGLSRRTSVWGKKSMFWILHVLFVTAGANVEKAYPHSTLGVSAPHLYYTCPEGATAKLLCDQKGAALSPTDILKHIWLFTPHSDQHCVSGKGPRHVEHSHNHTEPGLHFEHDHHKMLVTLQNVTYADQGRYCCFVMETKKDHGQKSVVQRSHSYIVLHVTPKRNGTLNCTVWDPTPPGGSVPVALALAACIVALLSLPLILVLVYRQRQNVKPNRRAQELVRMDSEAQCHENPVFLRGSPQTKTRTVSQILTRQSSETGRHLLSDPGTPLSPPAHGDVFFPSEDIISESPDFMQV